MKAVIDSNIIFSALLKPESTIKTFILNPENELYTCNFLFVEIFKYKEKIETFSHLEFSGILELMRILFSKIHFVNEALVPPRIFQQALELCVDIDEEDTPFIALSIFLNAPLITGDKKLMKGLRKKGFEEILLLESIFKTRD